MHIVVPRGTHTQADVEAAMPEHSNFAVTQWWPVTFVECELHGSECRAENVAKAVQNGLHEAGIESHIMQGPALHCEPCAS